MPGEAESLTWKKKQTSACYNKVLFSSRRAWLNILFPFSLVVRVNFCGVFSWLIQELWFVFRSLCIFPHYYHYKGWFPWGVKERDKNQTQRKKTWNLPFTNQKFIGQIWEQSLIGVLTFSVLLSLINLCNNRASTTFDLRYVSISMAITHKSYPFHIFHLLKCEMKPA